MSNWLKAVILAVLGCIIILIMLNPNAGSLIYGGKYKEFKVTANAAAVLDKSIKQGRPVFLEFYAKW